MMAATNSRIATSVLIPAWKLVFFRKKPSPTANTINSMDVIATAPSAANFTPSSSKPWNVLATTSAKAAITKIENSHTNIRNRRFPVLPIYFSMMYPMDLPLFFTDAYMAAKSCTAPKNTPPIKIQSSAGSQPKTAA